MDVHINIQLSLTEHVYAFVLAYAHKANLISYLLTLGPTALGLTYLPHPYQRGHSLSEVLPNLP